MTIDSSVINLLLPFSRTFPSPTYGDTSLTESEKQHIAYCYAGLLGIEILSDFTIIARDRDYKIEARERDYNIQTRTRSFTLVEEDD